MNLIFIIKGKLEKNVPIITLITVALGQKVNVSVICSSCEDKVMDLLVEKGARIHCSSHKTYGPSVMKKVLDWFFVRKEFNKILKEIYITGDLIYLGSLDTALAMGKKMLKYKYILHIRELYDKYPLYLRLIKPYARVALNVIVPEYNRSVLLKQWLTLEKKPIVIPNKPNDHPETKYIKVYDEKIQDSLDWFKGKKIILYQGNISRDRGITNLVDAVLDCIDESYVMILMGTSHNKYVEELQERYPQLYHIDYVPAPFHLQVTSYAYLGLVSYDDSCLNNLYCAPNKTYEYCGFGIPVLGNDIPGLKYTIGDSGAGICVNFSNVNEVKRAIKEIEANYELYSCKSKEFFENTNLECLFNEMIKG